MKPRSKSEIAKALNISISTLRRDMNSGCLFEELSALGYTKSRQILGGKMLHLICNHYGIIEEDFK